MWRLTTAVVVLLDCLTALLLNTKVHYDEADPWNFAPSSLQFSQGVKDLVIIALLRSVVALLSASLLQSYRRGLAVVVGGSGIYALVKLCAVHEIHNDVAAICVCGGSLALSVVEACLLVVTSSPVEKEGEDGVYMPLDAGEEEGGKKKGQGTSFRRVLSLAWPERYLLSTAMVCLLLATASQMIVPTIFGRIINNISKNHSQEELDKSILFLVVLFVFSQVFASIRGGLFNLSGERLVARFRVQVFDAILRQDIEFFDQNQTGELQSRLSNDTTVIQNAVTVNVSMGLRWLGQAVVGILILFALSWKLTLIMLSVVPLIAVGARQYGMFVRGISKDYQDSLGKAGESAEQSMSCIRTVRSFSKEDKQIEEYQRLVQVSYGHGKKRAIAYGIFLGVISLAMYLAIALVLWYGGRLVVSGSSKELDSAKLTAFLLYTIYIAVALGGMSGLYSQLMSAVGASERMFALIDAEPTIPTNGVLTDKAAPRPEGGRIRFEDVHFSYPARKDVKVLNSVSFESSPGEVTALVGPSGGGKSTIVSLILRFYDPSAGTILFDNVPLKNLDTFWLHKSLSVVSQEPTLFASSILDNIKFGIHAQVTKEHIIKAAKQANAHKFIMNFPDGYDTLVGERGVQLSGGQKQRIAIARAILVDPKVLLLDEATSALDSESEHLVQEALDRIMSTRTTLVIAHRLSTIRNADKILVIDGGRVVETGAHDELIKKPGSLYAALVKRQTESGHM